MTSGTANLNHAAVSDSPEQASSAPVGASVELRARICAAAAACFDRYGLRRTSMDDVASAAGVSRKTVYNYFKNKTSLIDEVIAEESRLIVAATTARLDPTLPGPDQIVQAELLLLESARQSRYASAILGPDAGTLLEVIHSAESTLAVARGFWLPILERLQRSGELRVDDLDDAVEWLVFIHKALLTQMPAPDADLEPTRRMLHRYVVPALLGTVVAAPCSAGHG